MRLPVAALAAAERPVPNHPLGAWHPVKPVYAGSAGLALLGAGKRRR